MFCCHGHHFFCVCVFRSEKDALKAVNQVMTTEDSL